MMTFEENQAKIDFLIKVLFLVMKFLILEKKLEENEIKPKLK